MSIVKKLSESKLLTKYLFFTNSVSSCGLMCFGDLIQQTIEHKLDQNKEGSEKKLLKYDWSRTAHMTAIGLPCGIFNHNWYKFLDKVLPRRDRSSIIKKLFADQFVGCPIIAGIFFFGLGAIEQKTVEESAAEFKSKFPIIFAVDCFVWPPAQAINFRFVPPAMRVLYVNMLILVYDVFLSFMKYRIPIATADSPAVPASIVQEKIEL